MVPNMPGSLLAASWGRVTWPMMLGSNHPGVGPRVGSTKLPFLILSGPNALQAAPPPIPVDRPEIPQVKFRGGPVMKLAIPLSCQPPKVVRAAAEEEAAKKGSW